MSGAAAPHTDVGMPLTATADDAGLFGWWRVASTASRRALVAAGLGWALDAFDVMLFSLTLAAVIADLGLTKTQAGALGSITLLGGAAGGLIFGHVADRFGRTKALMGAVLIYSIFTGACGLSQSLWQFAVLRALLGLGMGGVWAAGASLVSETWPSRIRGRVLASCRAPGRLDSPRQRSSTQSWARASDGAPCSSSGY